MSPLGPKKPIKKPKPKKVSFINDEYGWIDGNAELTTGTEIYVCINEEKPEFDLLESGIYTLSTGIELEVENGVII